MFLWKSRSTSYVPSVIAHGDHLFWVNDSGKAYCLEAKTGEVIYETVNHGLVQGWEDAILIALEAIYQYETAGYEALSAGLQPEFDYGTRYRPKF